MLSIIRECKPIAEEDMYTDKPRNAFCTLIVEDNKEFSEALGDLLCQHFPEMKVESAFDGESAIEKIYTNTPDVILMDVRLPGINGISLTKNLKSDGNRSIIIVLSTYDLDEYRQAAIKNGADCFISKGDPSCMADVVSRVQKAYVLKEVTHH